MNNKKITVIGASGLIGSHLMQQLANDEEVASVKAISRKFISFENAKITSAVIDFSDMEAFRSEIEGSDIVFCAVGTTQKKVKGNKEAYRMVDHDIPINAATLSAEAGCRSFIFVSSVGANAQSTSFYLKLKGEVENKICNMNFATVVILRPSLLLGKRHEFRLGEHIGSLIMRPISFLLPPKLKPIKASVVARAMMAAAKSDIKGVHVFHYQEMLKISQHNNSQ